MQSRRGTGLTPLAIVLPHPPLPMRRTSSLLSLNSVASPRTPRSCPSPSLPIYYPASRKSTDSWNSSNADDMDFEWKQDQVLFLSRTLDALPSHLLTPFNGSIPPSNLLDKLARGVSQAKGPADWPHSIRATRIKLLELARSRAKEEAAAEQRRHVIKEEVEITVDDGDSNYSYFHDGEEKPLSLGVGGIGPRRPLYRQSSMDFIKPSPSDIKDNANIARLSNRLQRTDRIFPNPGYHPYSRSHAHHSTNRRSSSPPHPTDVPALINPSTPSSTTLDSFSSLSSASAPKPRLQRSVSTMSSGSLFSTSSGGMPLDPRLQRVRRSDSFCSLGPPAPPPKDIFTSTNANGLPTAPLPSRVGYKRAPSYGALAQEAKAKQDSAAVKEKDRVHTHARKLSGSYPSSDEEEKARTKRAKKIRTKTGASAAPSSPSPPPSSVPSSPAGLGGMDTVPSSPVVERVPVPPAKDRASSPKVKSKSAEEGKTKSPKSPKFKPSSNKADESRSKTSKPLDKEKDEEMHAQPPKRLRAPPMNLQRNPSMFGAELPHLRNKENNTGLGSPAHPKMRSPSPAVRALPSSLAPALPLTLAPAPADIPSPPLSPSLSLSPSLISSPTQRVRTLRRVRRLAPARRISFGSLAAPGDEADADGEGERMDVTPQRGQCLESAFQLF